MAKNDSPKRRLRGYYGFSKKYPSRRGNVYAIGESRKMRKKERKRKILFAVILCVLFVVSYIFAAFLHNLSTRPIPAPPEENKLIITPDNIGTVRAVFLDNSVLEDMSELSKELTQAKKNGFNAVMLDFKTREGYLTYSSSVSRYSSSGDYNHIDSVIIDRIKSENMLLIARVFCFEDSISPQRLGAYVYEDAEHTKIWFDAPAAEGGKPWLNPTSQAAVNYLTTVIREVSAMEADCIYLDGVQFPPSGTGTAQFFTENDENLNRNAILLNFIEQAVISSGDRLVILGVPETGAVGGNDKLWGGTLFDTAASVCSPLILKPSEGEYASYAAGKYAELNDAVKNNFSTIKVIPTIQNQPDDKDFYVKMAESGADSYIIVP